MKHEQKQQAAGYKTEISVPNSTSNTITATVHQEFRNMRTILRHIYNRMTGAP